MYRIYQGNSDKLKYLFFCFLCLFCWQVIAQEKVTFSGIVRDENSSETLIGTAVYLIKDSVKYGGVTDFDGNFSIEVPKGQYQLKIEYIGFSPIEESIELNSNTKKTFSMAPDVITTKEVVVVGEKKSSATESTTMGEVELELDEIKKLPAFMGEVDVIKTLQLLPGVQSGGEGGTGIYVRGGNADQNLVLLDEAPLYSVGHMFGFFSVFNSDAISSVKLYKGNIPAYHSGRLSSVIEFDGAEGNDDSLRVRGGIGLIASRLSIDGSIINDKLKFSVAGRRSYMDVLTRPFEVQEGQYGIPYSFYDINAKLNYKIDDKNELFWSVYNGKDGFDINVFDGKLDANVWWGNTASTLGWKHSFSDDFKLNAFLIYNKFRFVSNSVFEGYETNIDSQLEEFHFKPRFRYYFSDDHRLDFGLVLSRSYYVPRGIDAKSNDDGTVFNTGQTNANYHSLTTGVYISDKIEWTKRFASEIGLAFNYYHQLGPYTYITNDNGSVVEQEYVKNEIVASYPSVEPRIGLKYSLDSVSSVKAAFAITTQFVHQVSLTGNSLPFDLWVPSSKKIPVQRGDQYSLGYYRDFNDKMFTSSVEVYYRRMRNQLSYRDDYVPTISGDLEDDFAVGKGKSYGLEFFFQKNIGKLKGWVSYTLAKTDRTFSEINEGKTFPFRYDRRHDLSIVASYDLNDHWILGANFVYSTGIATTIEVNRYFIEGNVIPEYGPKNGFRYPAYHRMDLSVTYSANKGKRVHSSWVLAIYNVYYRKNPYLIYVDPEEDIKDARLILQPKMIYLFGILPSLTWNFEF